MRKMGKMRLPWNVYENKELSPDYPGMLLINMAVSSFSRVETVLGLDSRLCYQRPGLGADKHVEPRGVEAHL